MRYFHYQTFSISKPWGVKRFFFFGGSTTFGFSLKSPKHQSYCYVLAHELERDWQKKIEVVNCGGIQYASYRLVGLVEECLEFSPDLMVVMCGHNEFLEPRHYADLINSGIVMRLWRGLRLAHLLNEASERMLSGRYAGVIDAQQKEKEMVLAADYVDERYIVRDDNEYQRTLEHYSRNLNRIVDLCRAHHTPLVLCTSASNLRDWEPFITEPGVGVSRKGLERLLDEVSELFDDQRYEDALAIAKTKVLSRSPRAAAFHYVSAKCLDALGRKVEAKQSYIRARNTDGFPHRTLTSFNECVRRIAAERDIRLLDVEALFMANSLDGIPGNNLFLDQCHPNAEGHQLIASELKAIVLKMGL